MSIKYKLLLDLSGSNNGCLYLTEAITCPEYYISHKIIYFNTEEEAKSKKKELYGDSKNVYIIPEQRNKFLLYLGVMYFYIGDFISWWMNIFPSLYFAYNYFMIKSFELAPDIWYEESIKNLLNPEREENDTD